MLMATFRTEKIGRPLRVSVWRAVIGHQGKHILRQGWGRRLI